MAEALVVFHFFSIAWWLARLQAEQVETKIEFVPEGYENEDDDDKSGEYQDRQLPHPGQWLKKVCVEGANLLAQDVERPQYELRSHLCQSSHGCHLQNGINQECLSLVLMGFIFQQRLEYHQNNF